MPGTVENHWLHLLVGVCVCVCLKVMHAHLSEWAHGLPKLQPWNWLKVGTLGANSGEEDDDEDMEEEEEEESSLADDNEDDEPPKKKEA